MRPLAPRCGTVVKLQSTRSSLSPLPARPRSELSQVYPMQHGRYLPGVFNFGKSGRYSPASRTPTRTPGSSESLCIRSFQNVGMKLMFVSRTVRQQRDRQYRPRQRCSGNGVEKSQPARWSWRSAVYERGIDIRAANAYVGLYGCSCYITILRSID